MLFFRVCLLEQEGSIPIASPIQLGCARSCQRISRTNFDLVSVLEEQCFSSRKPIPRLSPCWADSTLRSPFSIRAVTIPAARRLEAALPATMHLHWYCLITWHM